MQLSKEKHTVIGKIKDFVSSNNDIFVLTGAAGTGKTTVVKKIIDEIEDLVDEVLLLAPTNRAVKMLSGKTGIPAATVHNEIYVITEVKDDDGNVIATKFIPRISGIYLDDEDRESLKDMVNVYIVDESSMLSDSPVKSGDLLSDNSLMRDLYRHVKAFTPKSKIVFVGDSYQLPPSVTTELLRHWTLLI